MSLPEVLRYATAYGESWEELLAGFLADANEREVLFALADALLAGGLREPIRIEGNERLVTDGTHRVLAAALTATSTVAARVHWCDDIADCPSEPGDRPGVEIVFETPTFDWNDVDRSPDMSTKSIPMRAGLADEYWAVCDGLSGRGRGDREELTGVWWGCPLEHAHELAAEILHRVGRHYPDSHLIAVRPGYAGED